MSTRDASPAISVVTTLYYSAPYLREYRRRIAAALETVTDDYEIVLVNDGSPDDSLELAVQLHESDSRVTVIDLSRNFGHHRAMMIGLTHARGDHVFLVDADLEEEPELFLDYWKAMQQNPEYDVVYGSLEQRKGGAFERVSGWAFYLILNYLSGERMPRNYSLSRLMTKRYVKSLVEFQERELFIGGLWHIAGYGQMSVPVKKHSKGTSTYTFAKKLALFTNAIVSFSSKPLVSIFYTGLFIFSIASLASLYLIFQKVFLGRLLGGWTSIMVSLWLLGGLIILFLGIIGIYLAKVFTETKNRPYAIVRRKYEC